MSLPEIKPLAKPRGKYPQSKFPIDKVPFRLVLNATSQGGKSTLWSNLLMNWYPPQNRYYVVSPNIFSDDSLEPFREFVKEIQAENGTDYRSFHENFSEKDLAQVLSEQEEMTALAKRREMKFLPTLMVVLDDLGSVNLRNSSALTKLVIQGRHHGSSLIYNAHYLYTLPPLIRANVSSYAVFKPQNAKTVQMLVDELSNIVEPATLKKMLDLATSKPFGFLYINLRAPSKKLMFLNSLKSSMMKE